MLVDSYRFLPRSFAPLYADARPLPGQDAPVEATFGPRLSEARIALVSSAGLSLASEQPPFDLDRERREPTWGDPSYRVIPDDHLAHGPLAMSHLHVNSTDVLDDHNVALPTGVLASLVADGLVGAAAPRHVSVMGYQQAGLEGWQRDTGPAIIELFRADGVHGVVLAPV